MKKYSLILLMIMAACGGSAGGSSVATWDSFPILIQPASSNRSYDERAIEYWNDYFGIEIFSLTEDGEDYDCSVEFVEMAGDEEEFGAYTERTNDVCSIEVEWKYDERLKPEYPRLLAHELGHVLGIGHTDDPDSLMNPDVPLRRAEELFSGFVEEAFADLYPDVETDIINLDTDEIEGD